ncbi:TraR/DksA C4-type zinc finger protein [Citrobacter werkmanii]|uniref:TraR/DksA C4-type zinc finger protein n=1 Tax=Citrobacter werkmanii TaxID=67827 RepID=UPI0037CC32A7
MRDHAIQAHRLNHSAVSAMHCEECGEKLLDARRKAYPGCTMCVSCQGEQELRNKQRGGVIINSGCGCHPASLALIRRLAGESYRQTSQSSRWPEKL